MSHSTTRTTAALGEAAHDPVPAIAGIPAAPIAAERARLAKALATAEKERDALSRRLDSPGFAEKAKPEAVEKARADHAERSAEAERIGAALARLT